VFEFDIHKSGTTSLDMFRTSHENKARLASERTREKAVPGAIAGRRSEKIPEGFQLKWVWTSW